MAIPTAPPPGYACAGPSYLVDEEFFEDLGYDFYYEPENLIELWEAMQDDTVLRERVSSRHPWLYELRLTTTRWQDVLEKQDREDQAKSEELEFLATPQGEAYLNEIAEKQAYNFSAARPCGCRLENERNLQLARYEDWIWVDFDLIEEVRSNAGATRPA